MKKLYYSPDLLYVVLIDIVVLSFVILVTVSVVMTRKKNQFPFVLFIKCSHQRRANRKG